MITIVVVVRLGVWVITFQLPRVIPWRLEKGEPWLLNLDPATSRLDYELFCG